MLAAATPADDADVILIAHRLGAAARGRGARSCWRTRTSSPAWCRCRAWSGSRASPRTTATACCRPIVSARVAVEAGIAHAWHKLVGDTGEIVSIEHYGESADYKTLFREFGFTPEAVVAAAERSTRQLTQSTEGAPMTQNPNLAALSAAGVSVWLDDLSRERLQSGNLQELIDTKSVVGVTTNPSIFQAALSKGTAYDEQVARAGRARRRRRRHHPHRHHRRRAQRVRRAGRRPRRPPTASTAGCRIEVDPRLAHDTDKTIAAGHRAVEDRRPAQPADQDPGHRGGPARDHRGARRGHLRQRHADLLGRAPPRGDGRLPGRAGEGQGGRPRPVQDPLGGIVLRLPRGHRDRQAAGEDRHRRGAGAARQGRRRQRPARLRRLPGGVRRRRALRRAEGRRAPGCSGRCGRRPA